MHRSVAKVIRNACLAATTAAVALGGVAWARGRPADLPPPSFLIPERFGGNEIQFEAWLSVPDGPGPFSTVILLHGCNALNRNGWAHLQGWAGWLNKNNFAALIIDSFSPRDIPDTCGDPRLVPGELQAADFYTAADFVSRLPQLRGRKIGAIGFSHGGWGILDADAKLKPGIAELRARLQSDRIVGAFVAMYPGCGRHIQASFYAPLLILIGGADTVTSARTCEELGSYPRNASPEIRVKVYPNATHSFDVDKPPRPWLGRAVLRYDPQAAVDARHEIERFFRRWLE